MKKENLVEKLNKFYIEAVKELESKKEYNNNIINLFAEVKWTEAGIVEITTLNSSAIRNTIIDREVSEYSKEEQIVFNKDGAVDEGKLFLRPMMIGVQTYITNIPVILEDNNYNIIYPQFNKLF